MYEITMGNYVPISRFLHETVSEWFVPVILTYRCCVSFALMKVISGIFMHETFRTAASNDEIMIMQRDRATSRHVKKMSQLFHEADESDDGMLSFDEFQRVMEDHRVKTWLAAQDLEIRDVKTVYELVSDFDDAIDDDEVLTVWS
eukprot:TRINITY_DN53306_c0_g1_i18.p1 TRINITY_DN53306_c0_g1~~TRINITY_DN53306_c0_g1_i18.p1  ORF type:complete len:145 (-),score=19.65 TRINITY_DN53306_c0_g1_i18:251-685(-)